MNIQIELLAQLGQLAGGKIRSVAVDGPCLAQDVVRRALAEDSAEVRGLVFDEAGVLRRSVLMFVHDAQQDWSTPVQVSPGDTIVLSPPIAGG